MKNQNRESDFMEKRQLTVQEDEKMRIDVYLSEKLENISRASVKKLIVEENVLVNSKLIKPRYIVKSGDIIEVTFEEEEETVEILKEDIPLEVVYEDSDLAVINKPQGMVVHPATGNMTGTLVNALLFKFDTLSTLNGEDRPGIVHRIDKDTSGLLMIAKNDFAHEGLAEQLKEHTTTRKYYALVEGPIKEENGTIDAPIGRHRIDRKRMTVTETNSKEAVTHFSVLERFEKHTLIEAQLETGRTHQIRVHMAYINHPVVGDPVYGYKNQKFNLEGQLLFAKKIGFVHPRSGEYLEFEVELPEYFSKILTILRNSQHMDKK